MWVCVERWRSHSNHLRAGRRTNICLQVYIRVAHTHSTRNVAFLHFGIVSICAFVSFLFSFFFCFSFWVYFFFFRLEIWIKLLHQRQVLLKLTSERTNEWNAHSHLCRMKCFSHSNSLKYVNGVACAADMIRVCMNYDYDVWRWICICWNVMCRVSVYSYRV